MTYLSPRFEIKKKNFVQGFSDIHPYAQGLLSTRFECHICVQGLLCPRFGRHIYSKVRYLITMAWRNMSMSEFCALREIRQIWQTGAWIKTWVYSYQPKTTSLLFVVLSLTCIVWLRKVVRSSLLFLTGPDNLSSTKMSDAVTGNSSWRGGLQREIYNRTSGGGNEARR